MHGGDAAIDRTHPIPRVIAYYLPQYHPIPENDAWWGKGFTEWSMVMKARPMFKGHYQPHFPGELGFYDLRVPEVREHQASLARAHGIEAFCYWHYWLGNGRRLLYRPFDEVLRTREPDFPFCLAWVNCSWQSCWLNAPRRLLAEQVYPGDQDHLAHMELLLKAFADPRYLTVAGKPIFIVLFPKEVPEVGRATDLWRNRVEKAGLPGLHLVGMGLDVCEIMKLGFDAATYSRHRHIAEAGDALGRNGTYDPLGSEFELLRVSRYRDVLGDFLKAGRALVNEYPTIAPNWDNTPRLGPRGAVLHDAHPEFFQMHVREALSKVAHIDPEHRVIFVRSWNEWAEGNHLEPDERYGRAYLEVLRDELRRAATAKPR